MASTCISNCINDTRIPLRTTYVNLYKWPESDAEFVRSLSSDGRSSWGGRAHSAIVDSISCRQMYLRSYTFHRNETDDQPEETKCFGRVKKGRAGNKSDRRRKKSKTVAKIKCLALRRAKKVSCAVLLAVFRRLLSCTINIDAADPGN